MRASGAKQMSCKCHSAQNFPEPQLLTQPPPPPDEYVDTKRVNEEETASER